MDLCILCLVFIFQSLKAEIKYYDCEPPEIPSYIRGVHHKFGAKIEEKQIRELQQKGYWNRNKQYSTVQYSIVQYSR